MNHTLSWKRKNVEYLFKKQTSMIILRLKDVEAN